MSCCHVHHHSRPEKRVWYVLFLTLVVMFIEIISGIAYGSIALQADGWHMATHAIAFSLAIFIYWYERKQHSNNKFIFGTGKINFLGGYTSAIFLAIIALSILIESLERFFIPTHIDINQALYIAFLGLGVNIASIFLLHGEHKGDDYNLKAVYIHILSDILTSILAIIALFFGKVFGWLWLDPIVGIVGCIIILKWSWNIIKETSPILLDKKYPTQMTETIKQKIEENSIAKVIDLNIWQVGSGNYASIVKLSGCSHMNTDFYKNILKSFSHITHTIVEFQN